MTDNLASAIAEFGGQPASTRVGTVVGIVDGAGNPLLQISPDNSGKILEPDAVGVLNDYAANVGDRVALLGQSVQGGGSSVSSWLCLGRITKSTVNAWAAKAVSSPIETTNFNTNSAAFTTAGGPLSGVAFYGPASGRALVVWNAEISNATSFILLSPQISTGLIIGAGTFFPGWQANSDRTRRADPTGFRRAASADLVTGLTPGAPYNVVLYHAVNGGSTGSINRRSVGVYPQP